MVIIDDGINEYHICNSSSNPDRTTEMDAKIKAHSERVLVGYGKGLPITARISRAYLTSISEKIMSAYVYFGGFVGQGNITRILNLPDDAIIESAYMELNPGNDFYLYVNGIRCGDLYPGVGWNSTASAWNLNKSCFSPGRNEIEIRFNTSGNNFIGGG